MAETMMRRLFRRLRRGARSRYRQIRMTLSPGQRMRAGALVVTPMEDGRIIVETAPEFAAFLTVERGGLRVLCHVGQGPDPVRIDDGDLRRRAQAPLVSLGQGDYRRDYYTDMIGAGPDDCGSRNADRGIDDEAGSA